LETTAGRSRDRRSDNWTEPIPVFYYTDPDPLVLSIWDPRSPGIPSGLSPQTLAIGLTHIPGTPVLAGCHFGSKLTPAGEDRLVSLNMMVNKYDNKMCVFRKNTTITQKAPPGKEKDIYICVQICEHTYYTINIYVHNGPASRKGNH